MATLGVLGSLMSQLGATQMPQYNPQEVARAQQLLQSGRMGNETALIQLEDLRRQQEAQTLARQAIQQDPSLLFGGGGGMPQSTLGSLTAGSPGAITQTPLGGGPAQTIPAYPDASRYAAVSPQGGGPLPAGVGMPTVTPPQSTLGSLAPQPQAPSPQDRLTALARVNPDAARLLQQQMQQQQDRQWKLQEQQLDMGVKVSEAVARQLQGVTDQASLDEARERIRLIHPQAAAQIPQFYSKEAVEALQQRGIAVADVAKWRKDMAGAKNLEMQTEQLPSTFRALEQFVTGGGTTPAAEPPPSAGPTTTRSAIPRTVTISPQFQTKAQGIADRLETNVENLYRVMSFETGGELSPATRNRTGSGATGLIQFTPETAKALGTTTDALAKMTPEQQLDYVEKYLEPYKGKIGTLKDLYMAVLYPAALGKPDDTVLFSPEKTPTAYRQNAGLDTGKKGYVTVGDAVAAVERSTGGGGGAAAGPADRSGTVQAPPRDPRAAQIETRIKHGQALALRLSATPGMEQAATMVNQQINDLQRDLDRLDAPRQAFLNKQAVQPLELQQQREQGLAAAQVKADTEPASKEEIDAINRTLPPDKRIPYSTTRKTIRERGLVGADPIAPKIVEELTTTTTAIQNFEELSKAVTALPTGPLTQYVESFKERWGIDISDEKVAQRAILAGAANQLLTARSGAAVSPSEYTRLMNELPNEGNDPKVFKARLANTLRQFKNIYKTKVQILRKTGHAIPDDLLEPLAAPEATPAPTVTSNVDKFRDIKR